MTPSGGVWSQANALISNLMSLAVGLVIVRTALVAPVQRDEQRSTENEVWACATPREAVNTAARPTRAMNRNSLLASLTLELHGDEHGILKAPSAASWAAGHPTVDDELARVVTGDAAVEQPVARGAHTSGPRRVL
jgi:hypothetical protein